MMNLRSGNSLFPLADFGHMVRRRIIIRDDQVSWEQAWDLARQLRKQKKALVLIDTGLFSMAQLEWVVEAKTVVISYLEADRDWPEMLLLKKVSERSCGGVVFALRRFPGAKKNPQDLLRSMRQMGRGGVDLHVSGLDQPFESEALVHLAHDCRRGGAWFVYYHHGPVESWLNALAQEGAWLHLSGEYLRVEHLPVLEELLGLFPDGKVRLVFHCHEASPEELKEIVIAHGGYIVHLLPPGELLNKKRRHWKPPQRDLPFRAYHLDPKAMF